MPYSQHQGATDHVRKLLQDQVLITSKLAITQAINASTLIAPPPSPTSQQTLYSATESSLDPNTNFSPSVAVILIALLSAFFFMGFFSIYVRRCVDDPDRRVAAHRAGGVQEQRYNQNQQGLDPNFLHSLPLIAYSSVKKKGSNVECAVCLTEFGEHEPLRQLPKCKHIFHQDCIDMWLFSHATCPMCRRNLGDVESRSVSLRWGGGSANFQGLLESTRGSGPPRTTTEDGRDVEMNRTTSGNEHNQISCVVSRDNSLMVPCTTICGDFCVPRELQCQEGDCTCIERDERQPMGPLKRCNSTGHSVMLKSGTLLGSLLSVGQATLMRRSGASTSSNVGCFLNHQCLRRSSSTTALGSNVALP